MDVNSPRNPRKRFPTSPLLHPATSHIHNTPTNHNPHPQYIHNTPNSHNPSPNITNPNNRKIVRFALESSLPTTRRRINSPCAPLNCIDSRSLAHRAMPPYLRASTQKRSCHQSMITPPQREHLNVPLLSLPSLTSLAPFSSPRQLTPPPPSFTLVAMPPPRPQRDMPLAMQGGEPEAFVAAKRAFSHFLARLLSSLSLFLFLFFSLQRDRN